MADPATSQLVTAFLDAINRQDAEALVALCRPDVEFQPLLGPPSGLPSRGADGVRRWLSEIHARFPGTAAHADHAEAVHGGIVVTGTTAGPAISYAWHAAIRLEGGLIADWYFYPSAEHARRALASRWPAT